MANPYAANKLLRHSDSITEWQVTGHTSAPIGFDLCLTNKCPHNCPACIGKRDKKKYLSQPDAIEIINGFADLGAKGVNFVGGGEPLAHPDCAGLIYYATTQGLTAGLITNLYRLSDKDAETLARYAAWVRVSLDAGSAEGYARVHGTHRRAFYDVLKNLRKLASFPNRNATVGTAYLVDDTTIGELEQACYFAHDAGADYIQVRPFNHYTGKPVEFLNWVADKYTTDDFKVSVGLHKFGEQAERTFTKCHGAHFWTRIAADGDMTVCCETNDPNYVIGNTYKQDVKWLWQNCAKGTIDAIDLNNCPAGCHMCGYSTFLEEIANPIEHENHL